jgi:hypothetical protein
MKRNGTKETKRKNSKDIKQHTKEQPSVEKSPSPNKRTTAAVSYHQHHPTSRETKMSTRIRGRLETLHGMRVDDIYDQSIIIVIREYAGGQDDKKRNDRHIITAPRTKINKKLHRSQEHNPKHPKELEALARDKKGVQRSGDDAVDTCGWERENKGDSTQVLVASNGRDGEQI